MGEEVEEEIELVEVFIGCLSCVCLLIFIAAIAALVWGIVRVVCLVGN